MKRLVTATLATLVVAATPAFACATQPAVLAAEAAVEAKSNGADAEVKTVDSVVEAKSDMVHRVVEAKSKTADPATEAKFETADKNNTGTLEGPEIGTYKAAMVRIDTNKDGKVSREEFAAALKAGHIK